MTLFSSTDSEIVMSKSVTLHVYPLLSFSLRYERFKKLVKTLPLETVEAILVLLLLFPTAVLFFIHTISTLLLMPLAVAASHLTDNSLPIF